MPAVRCGVLALFLLALPTSSRAHFILVDGEVVSIKGQITQPEVTVEVGEMIAISIEPDPGDECVGIAFVQSSWESRLAGSREAVGLNPSFELTALVLGRYAAEITFAYDGFGNISGCWGDFTTTYLNVNIVDDVPPPNGEPIADGSANFNFASTAEDPINTFTGELFARKPRDLDLGGPMPLYFQRYYGSYVRRSFVVGDLGSNWRHNFDARLTRSGNSITYVSRDGRVTEFLDVMGTADWEQLTNSDTPYQLSAEPGETRA